MCLACESPTLDLFCAHLLLDFCLPPNHTRKILTTIFCTATTIFLPNHGSHRHPRQDNRSILSPGPKTPMSIPASRIWEYQAGLCIECATVSPRMESLGFLRSRDGERYITGFRSSDCLYLTSSRNQPCTKCLERPRSWSTNHHPQSPHDRI